LEDDGPGFCHSNFGKLVLAAGFALYWQFAAGSFFAYAGRLILIGGFVWFCWLAFSMIGVVMSRDLRKYTSQTNVQLAAGALTLLFVVGLGLIAWIYGTGAAVMGFLCLLGALVPVGLIVLLMFGLDIIVKRINKD
jgi:magnesium-transporting ATPase (P-type)